MPIRSSISLAVVLTASNAVGVVIDDFTACPIVVATGGELFDAQSAEQTGLPTAAVALGGRSFIAQQRDGVVSLTVDTSGGGRFTYDTGGGPSGINTFVRYSSDAGVNLTTGGENAIVFAFESAEFDDASNPFNPTVGFLDLTVLSSGGGRYQYVRVPSSDEPFNLAIPFSLLDGFDPTDLVFLEFGTGNGNLHGPFTLTSIESRHVAPGDYNADGVVDLRDYTLWRDMAASDFYVYHADGNGDGVVDATDYQVWLNAMGAAAADVVPEPAGGAVVALLVAAAAGRRGSR